MSNPLILLDVPDHIETERLHLRIPRHGDGAVVHAAIEESRQHLLPWLPFAHDQTAEGTETFVRRMASGFLLREDFVFLMFRREDGVYVGSCGMHRRNPDVPSFEIGYWVRASQEGHGYVTEAARAVTRYGFEHLGAGRLEIRCDIRNQRSAAVAERLGYRQEACLRHDARAFDGIFRDTLVFGLLREEWPG